MIQWLLLFPLFAFLKGS